jgi:hypothetical protein
MKLEHATTPRKGHLAMAEDILGYLRKCPNHGYILLSTQGHQTLTSNMKPQIERKFWRTIPIIPSRSGSKVP